MATEEGIAFNVPKGIFYNPQMRFCRSFSSLAVGATREKIEVADAFCASGIRGIRYARENPNVTKTTFIDIEKTAIAAAKKNARTAKIKASAVAQNISLAAFDLQADFVEIDPFGTPAPYLVDAMRFFNTRKSAFLSVTATDVAVLCGARRAACLKNYHSKPLNVEFTHEVGQRIMLKRVAEVAAEFNLGMSPLVSISDRHYLKSVVHLRRGADAANVSMEALGHISYCPKCGFRSSGLFPVRCTSCGAESDYAGQLWLGELHSPDFLASMIKLNRERGYADKQEIAKMLALLEGEVGMPPYYYNVHTLCRKHGMKAVPPMDVFIKRLAEKGNRVVRTHFSPLSVKTAAPFRDIVEALEWKS